MQRTRAAEFLHSLARLLACVFVFFLLQTAAVCFGSCFCEVLCCCWRRCGCFPSLPLLLRHARCLCKMGRHASPSPSFPLFLAARRHRAPPVLSFWLGSACVLLLLLLLTSRVPDTPSLIPSSRTYTLSCRCVITSFPPLPFSSLPLSPHCHPFPSTHPASPSHPPAPIPPQTQGL